MCCKSPRSGSQRKVKSKIKFVVGAHDHAHSWFDQFPLGGIFVQEKWTKLLKPCRAVHGNLFWKMVLFLMVYITHVYHLLTLCNIYIFMYSNITNTLPLHYTNINKYQTDIFIRTIINTNEMYFRFSKSTNSFEPLDHALQPYHITDLSCFE